MPKSDKPKKKGAGMAPQLSRLVYLSAVHCKGLQEYAPVHAEPSHSPPPGSLHLARQLCEKQNRWVRPWH